MKLQSVVQYSEFIRAVALCDQYKWPHVKLSFILGFIGLLRISNMAPESAQELDLTRNTLLQDIEVVNQTLVVKVKWAKNLQVGAETLSLPKTKHSFLCPVQSWLQYVHDYLPQGIDQQLPLLLEKHNDVLIIIDQCALRKLQHKVWHSLGLGYKNYTPHSLRRGGATFFAEQGLPLDKIKKLGMWKSDAIQVYLKKLNFQQTQLFNFVRTM